MTGARYHSMQELLTLFPNNATILEAVIKTEDHINTVARNCGKITVSVSGGSDSDIILDMFERLGYDDGEVVYVWFDTGLEYDATKRHLKYLEQKYGIEIKRYRPAMTVAQATKKFGVPFLSKRDSMYIKRLQRHGFDWIDGDISYLSDKYGECVSALKWWCNAWGPGKFSIGRSAGLKEFLMINNPPRISDECCEYAKKKTANTALKETGAVLNVIGIRRSEGGIRSSIYKSCFDEATENRVAQFRPIFYFTDQDKQEYKEFCGVTYSDCYEVWGFKRTGCCCCPFGSGFEEQLETTKKYEPKLYAAACKIFGPSYEYTRAYRRFKEAYKKEKRRGGQIDLFDNPSEMIKDRRVKNDRDPGEGHKSNGRKPAEHDAGGESPALPQDQHL